MTAADSIPALLCWWLFVYGLTLCITGAKITEPLRHVAERWPLLHVFLCCPMCVGWWVGGATALGLQWPLLTLTNKAATVAASAFAASAACWSTHVVLAHLGAEEL